MDCSRWTTVEVIAARRDSGARTTSRGGHFGRSGGDTGRPIDGPNMT